MNSNSQQYNLLKGVVLGLCIGVILVTTAWSASLLKGEPLLPISVDHGQAPGKVALGKQLFHDSRLSADDSVSCASCHPLASGGMDQLPESPGIGGQLSLTNTPTVFNSSLNFVQFWDGRAPDLASQVEGPVHNTIEMGSDWLQVVAKLRADSNYPSLFNALYQDGITAANISDAIASFEASLLTIDSRFDRWLRGDEAALNDQEEKGYRLFKSYGCVACHQGANIGGNMYHQMGALGDYFGDRGGEIEEVDLGRYNVTGDEQDKHFFKVPGLRLAILTSPYFHDGSVAHLEEAILKMAHYQLGRTLSEDKMRCIIAFLESVVGKHPGGTP